VPLVDQGGRFRICLLNCCAIAAVHVWKSGVPRPIRTYVESLWANRCDEKRDVHFDWVTWLFESQTRPDSHRVCVLVATRSAMKEFGAHIASLIDWFISSYCARFAQSRRCVMKSKLAFQFQMAIIEI
jgi:hypothetical protein